MKRLRIVLLRLFAAALASLLAGTSSADDLGNDEGLKLMNAQMSQELRARAAGIGAASNFDTTWVGFTPGHEDSRNYWSVYAGFGKDGFHRPPLEKGMWCWETQIHGDSLQGWWPRRLAYTSTGGQTRTDRNRPWWATDQGNQACYVINQGTAHKRTLGVVGVWHRDAGSNAPAPGGVGSPTWAPLGGQYSAWMGLRRHGDYAFVDPITRNAFNETVLQFSGQNAASPGGNDKGFPGYGSQMDQMLYRDIDLSASPGANLTLCFTYRTNMSTDFGTAAATRTGWFDKDPLQSTAGATNPAPGNFISSSDAGNNAPRDSFMVYVGAPVVDSACVHSNGEVTPVYDPQRRWFSEVIRCLEGYYQELESVTGNVATVRKCVTIPNPTLSPILAASGGRIRLVFRVKTNRGFDDEGSAYSSNGAGAAVVDDVTYTIGAGTEVAFGDFEDEHAIDNDTAVDPRDAWKSTGKPPAVYFHTHALSDLIYNDLCGQPGDASRICDLNGVVVSMGDHDNSEAAGGLIDGTTERQTKDGIASPVICLTGPFDGPGGRNAWGLYPLGGNGGVGDIQATEDYYEAYDIYAGVFDPFGKGNLWQFGFQSYPGNAKASSGGYPAWGQVRYPGFVIFNPDIQCFPDLEAGYRNNLIKTSNASGIPDSLRLLFIKIQECFRFGISGCSRTDGAYVDNMSLAIIDGPEVRISADIWYWINDTFPANETAGIAGIASKFDTTAAILKTGLNTGPNSGSTTRPDIPGDSMVVVTAPGTERVDLVFRILPGPGNYTPVGDPHSGYIRRVPSSATTVTPGDGSFWDAYRSTPGSFASPNASSLHLSAKGGWNANVWNSARCDTAEVNVFAFQSRFVQGGPGDNNLWMSCLHESDPHFAALGQVTPRCYIKTPTSDPNDVVCDGTVPAYVACNGIGANCVSTGYAANSTTTREYSKIIPDGLLTPGSHVEYFFRQLGNDALTSLLPDTNHVTPQIGEGSTDGHRWQEFSVLPDRWKDPAYRHPVFQTFGHGPACLLVVDNNDRRGNERVWVSVADTIGATAQQRWGAHNGWHARGGADINDPAQNLDPAGRVGFTAEHGGSPGTTWDMYQVKASESLTTQAGSLGSRLANRSNAQTGPKSSRQGPTPDMMDAYYTLMLILSGDLNSGVLGPFTGRSQDDVALITGWLQHGNTVVHNRGIWAMGDGFVESNWGEGGGTPQDVLMTDYFGVTLRNGSYVLESGNTENAPDLIPIWRICPVKPGDPYFDIWGVGNLCLWTNDVLQRTPGLLGQTADAAKYEDRPGPVLPLLASVFKEHSAAKPWQALVDGFDIEHLTSRFERDTRGRSRYFYEIFTWLWSKIWTVAGTPLIPLEVPQLDDGALVDFAQVNNNPLRSGDATIVFGLTRSDRVDIDVYDVTGRRVRSLAHRTFPAGQHRVMWDGADDGGRPAPRGVYFTRVRYATVPFQRTTKLTVLR